MFGVRNAHYSLDVNTSLMGVFCGLIVLCCEMFIVCTLKEDVATTVGVSLPFSLEIQSSLCNMCLLALKKVSSLGTGRKNHKDSNQL